MSHSIRPIISYLSGSFRPSIHDSAQSQKREKYPALTFSQESGARGETVAALLLDEFLAKQSKSEPPWTLLDSGTNAKVLKANQLSDALAKYLPEDSVSLIDSTIGELVGQHPSLWDLQQKCHATLTQWCRLGHVILFGRGGCFLARNFSNVAHVRFIGSLDVRARYVAQQQEISQEKARQFIDKEDTAKARFAKTHFNEKVERALNYNLIINTDFLSNETIAETIKGLLHSKCGKPTAKSKQMSSLT